MRTQFLGQARGAGVVAALAEGGLEAAGLPGLEVADAPSALGELAAAWRCPLRPAARRRRPAATARRR